MTQICSSCSAPITKHSRTGRCQKCASRASNAQRVWTEEKRAQVGDAVRSYWNKLLTDPVKRAEAVERGKRANAAYASLPEIRAKQLAGRRRSHWVPEEFRDFNRQLVRKGLTSAQRKEIIAAEVSAREAKRLAALTPFERQLDKVASGAKLVAKPNLRSAGYAYTLGGVALGAL